MAPVSVASLPMDVPQSGIYLFSENGRHLYVGRTNTIRKQLQNHCRPSSGHNSATFAFRLAREITGQTVATYTEKGSRTHLENDPVFDPVFIEQKARVKRMEVRYVSEPNPKGPGNLIVPDNQRAKRYLTFIGYYRLSVYFLPFQNDKDKFNNGTKFDDILNLYIFDRKLKLLVLDAIERIEIAAKAVISNYMSQKFGIHWFLIVYN